MNANQDFRGDPRHAAQDRRPTRLARNRGRAAEARLLATDAVARPQRLSLSDAPSIDADEEHAPAGDLHIEPTSAARRQCNVAALAGGGRGGSGRCRHGCRQAAPGSSLAAASARMLGGITRAFGTRRKRRCHRLPEPIAARNGGNGRATLDLDQPLDPKIANRPLEPGSGAPDLNAIMRRVRDERGQPAKHNETEAAKSDFIAAARRAAQAAAAEAEIAEAQSGDRRPGAGASGSANCSAQRKPILMAAAAVMVALAGLQLGKAFLKATVEVASCRAPSRSDRGAADRAEYGRRSAMRSSRRGRRPRTAEAR